MDTKLAAGQKNFLRLIQKEAAERLDGWAKVSEQLWPLIVEMPTELVELKPKGNARFCRLTDSGRAVLMFL